MTLEDIIVYLCKAYPVPMELSKARLTKLVYLADWESCKRYGNQLSNIKWYFHNFGPYVDDVVAAARGSQQLNVIVTENFYGEKKEVIRLRDGVTNPSLDRHAEEILDAVVSDTKNLFWEPFIEYVYATPPIAQSQRYTQLNLRQFAKMLTNSSSTTP